MRLIEVTAMDVSHWLITSLKTVTVHDELKKVFRQKNTKLTDSRSRITLSMDEVKELRGY